MKIGNLLFLNIISKNQLLKTSKTIIFLLFNIFLINSFYYKTKNNSIDNIKVCLCTLGKNENRYTIEFIEHYKRYGVDKIFIYDNNDINGEKFESVAFNYIKNKYIEILNFRGKYKIQLEVLNHCYKNNYNIYDWFLFYDMDEFIFLRNYKNVKYFLINKKFKKCNVIYLNEVVHLDNNQIYYKNKSLSERFTEIKNNSEKNMVKSILRGHLDNINITNNHIIDYDLKSCNSLGKRIKIVGIHVNKIDYTNYFFDHYFFKSSEEYLDKLRRGSCFWGNLRNISFTWISVYLKNNRLTKEKIDYFENISKINLSIFRNRLMSNKSKLQIL